MAFRAKSRESLPARTLTGAAMLEVAFLQKTAPTHPKRARLPRRGHERAGYRPEPFTREATPAPRHALTLGITSSSSRTFSRRVATSGTRRGARGLRRSEALGRHRSSSGTTMTPRSEPADARRQIQTCGESEARCRKDSAESMREGSVLGAFSDAPPLRCLSACGAPRGARRGP
jgi:hypothetical protein